MQISVVIPCFNAAPHLASAVWSVLIQDVAAEIIIVDDASTDTTAKIGRELAKQHKQIRFIGQSKNQGPGHARNVGLEHASGKYVCFLDADDQYETGSFSACLRLFAEKPALTVMFPIKFIDLPDRIKMTEDQYKAVALCLASNLMINTNFCRLIGGFSADQRFRTPLAGEDTAFRHALAIWGPAIEWTNKAYLRHLYRPGGHLDRYLTLGHSADDLPALNAAMADRAEFVKKRMIKALSHSKNIPS